MLYLNEYKTSFNELKTGEDIENLLPLQSNNVTEVYELYDYDDIIRVYVKTISDVYIINYYRKSNNFSEISLDDLKIELDRDDYIDINYVIVSPESFDAELEYMIVTSNDEFQIDKTIVI
jgi:hypothetical protein